ncbi:hypothetical protein [Streptomyces afghaniensis]|uniref:hypothetical protein n=1 Tax=Streptomyces afghaniensis TaxID=66865 RepID=UPI0037919B06
MPESTDPRVQPPDLTGRIGQPCARWARLLAAEAVRGAAYAAGSAGFTLALLWWQSRH